MSDRYPTFKMIDCKIIILELLNRAAFPLSNKQITDFIISYGITDYFHTQEALNALDTARQVDCDRTNNTTLFTINDNGKATLPLFSDHVNPRVIADIDEYCRAHSIEMRSDNALVANYDYSSYGGFTCHFSMREDDQTIIDLSLHVGSEELAKTLCTNWKTRHADVYEALIDLMM